MSEGREMTIQTLFVSPNAVFVDTREAPGEERQLRVLAIRADCEQIALLDLRQKNADPYWTDFATVQMEIEAGLLVEIPDPMRATLRPDSKLSEAEIRTRDSRLSFIKAMVASPGRIDLEPEARRKAIADLACGRSDLVEATTGPIRRESLLRYLRLYWRRGQIPNALVPAFQGRGGRGKARPGQADAPKRGRPRDGVEKHGIVGINVTDIVKAAIFKGYRYRNHFGLSDRQAVDYINRELLGRETIMDGLPTKMKPLIGEQLTLRQFRYHVQKEKPLGQRYTDRFGEIAFQQKARPKLSTTADMPTGPGSIYQIDATIGDIYLRCTDDPNRIIGRPVIYLIIDMYSGMFVGFHVCLSGPSWETARMALGNAFSDKVKYCADIGIKISEEKWPSHHISSYLIGDRGWDHLSKHAGAAAKNLRYELSNCPPRRPDLKGLVEGAFDVVNVEFLRFAPGSWPSRDASEPRNDLDCCYSLREFEKFMALNIIRYNTTHQNLNPPSGWNTSKGRAPTPVQIWLHGCARGAPESEDVDWIRIATLSTGTAREMRGGLRFNRVHYVPPRDRDDLASRFVKVPGRKWKSVEVKWHPGRADVIYILAERSEDFVMFQLSPGDERFLNYTFDEIDDWFSLQGQDRREARPELDLIESQTDAQITKLNEQARANGMGKIRRTRRPRADLDARSAEARSMSRATPMPGAPPLVPQEARRPTDDLGEVAAPLPAIASGPLPWPGSGTKQRQGKLALLLAHGPDKQKGQA